MQVYSIVEKEAQMKRAAQRIREIVLSQLSVYIRVCGDKNDEPCCTHAKKYLNSICSKRSQQEATLLGPTMLSLVARC